MSYIIEIMPQILDGMGYTLGVFVITLVVSLPLGGLLGLCRVTKIKSLRWISGVYTWILRGTPLMLQILLIYFGLPLIGFKLFGRLTSIYVAFVLNYVAYFAEIFKSGIQSIESGQIEAATLLGMNTRQISLKIIFPQVIKRTLPSIGNEVITLIKDTSLVYVVGLAEILKIAKTISSRDVTIAPYLAVGIIYLILTAVITKLLSGIEKKVYYEE